MSKKELTGQLTMNSKQNMKNTNVLSAAANRNGYTTYAKLGSTNRSAACQCKWADFKNNLVSRLSSEFPEVQSRLVHQAVVEADALASLTGVACLILPTLAEEKVAGLRDW